jgi:exopolysaccharide production protein ExoY
MRKIDIISDLDPAKEARLHYVSPSGGAMFADRRSTEVQLDWLKYFIDVFFASVALVVLMPMILMLVVIMLVVQGRPIFIGHRRVGRDGVMFSCLKFRTMVTNADEILVHHLASHPELKAEWNATRKLRDDPRVTTFGKGMRKSSIDEIPQLLNVIRGEMSLVGPRPITSSEAKLYGVHVVDYMAVRPGLTGLWQVSGRSETSYKKRVELDVRYVAERSMWGDISIMAKTIPAVLSSRGSY